jgi:predicted metalloprotease
VTRKNLLIGALVVVVAVALVAGGALLFGGGDRPGPTPTPGPESTTTSTVVAQGGCVSLEDCYSYEQMQQFVDRVLPLIDGFFDRAYRQMPGPQNIYYIAEGDTGPEPCTDAEGNQASYDSGSYEYCPVNEAIYLGQAALWELYNVLGDAAAATGIAHEWGHHVQKRAGVETPDTQQGKIDHENQADCIAGAWVRDMTQRNVIEYPDDLEDIAGLLVTIASLETNPNRTHGTLEERRDSFVLGQRGGLGACNGFFPDTPIIT